MIDYVERMIFERKELIDRIKNLQKRIVNYDFVQEIGEDKSNLLLAQAHIMEVYDFVLYRRLLLEVNEGNCTLDDITF